MTTLTIQQSEDYFLHINVRPVPTLPGQFALTIESQWLGALNPEGRQVRFATTLAQDDAMRVADAIVNELILENV
jgi:hypothetical protein